MRNDLQFPIHNAPEGPALWRSISGNFQRFPEIVNEFVDNSLSNFRAHQPAGRRVEIHLRPVAQGGPSPWRTPAAASGTSTPP